MPWESGAGHKELMSQARETAGFVFLVRDAREKRGAGQRKGQLAQRRAGFSACASQLVGQLD